MHSSFLAVPDGSADSGEISPAGRDEQMQNY
ncbi:hypothetical protein SKA58_14582 [Sphingomonas sp. SKA58]|jgi:hypothetical protein|nr:hypothetical protein SKA58_14582 [Sphingomonas sp. SKA58]